ncbi:MAG: hypothetical protein ACLFST_02395 [Spirochaetia bacterium]
MRIIVHGDTPDFSSSWGEKIFRVGRMYRDILPDKPVKRSFRFQTGPLRIRP